MDTNVAIAPAPAVTTPIIQFVHVNAVRPIVVKVKDEKSAKASVEVETAERADESEDIYMEVKIENVEEDDPDFFVQQDSAEQEKTFTCEETMPDGTFCGDVFDTNYGLSNHKRSSHKSLPGQGKLEAFKCSFRNKCPVFGKSAVACRKVFQTRRGRVENRSFPENCG